MEKVDHYKAIMEKLMKKPFDDEELESVGKKGSVITISVAGEESEEKDQDRDDAIDAELKKRGVSAKE